MMFFILFDESDDEVVIFVNIFVFFIVCLMVVFGFVKVFFNLSCVFFLFVVVVGIWLLNNMMKLVWFVVIIECFCCFVVVFSVLFIRKVYVLFSCVGKINEKFICYFY